jgi:hypothetical protein
VHRLHPGTTPYGKPRTTLCGVSEIQLVEAVPRL